MREENAEKLSKLNAKINRINAIINGGYLGGVYDKVLKYIEKGEELIKRFQEDLPEEIKILPTLWLCYRAWINGYRGNLALCFKDANEALMIAKQYGHKRGISNGLFSLGFYYYLSGDLDEARAQIDHGIRVIEDNLNDAGDFASLAFQLESATRLSIEKEDLERAKKYFMRLEEIRELKPTDIFISPIYKITKSYLLKSSMRSRDRALAEDLLREIIEEDSTIHLLKLRALFVLCELLLVELRISNDINIIGEIKHLLEKLIDMAQISGLYYYLIDAYILHGKLALIMFDLESSQRYLTQARRRAERHGYIVLAEEITGLHEAMMEKMETWKQMEKNNAPLSERMELARLNDHLNGKFLYRMMKMEKINEGEVTVYKGSQACLVCKGNAEGFNIYVCPTCNAFYCKKCAHAVIDLENQCWSCNSPIDDSKPVKPYKPEIEVEDTKESKKSKKY